MYEDDQIIEGSGCTVRCGAVPWVCVHAPLSQAGERCGKIGVSLRLLSNVSPENAAMSAAVRSLNLSRPHYWRSVNVFLVQVADDQRYFLGTLGRWKKKYEPRRAAEEMANSNAVRGARMLPAVALSIWSFGELTSSAQLLKPRHLHTGSNQAPC